MNKTPNNSIKCSVNSCAYHCGEQNYCTLNEIKVGCCDSNVTNCASPSAPPSSWATTAAAASAEPSIHAKSRVPDRERAIFMVFTPWARQAPRPWGRQRPPLQASPQLEPRA